MQPIKILVKWLHENVNHEHYIFTLQDFRLLLPELSDSAFKTLMSRAVKGGILEKICRNLYTYNANLYSKGHLLFHAATYLRSCAFNYISLETALSDLGIISQVPINTITIMTSGRSNIISCHRFGIIEFIHTQQKPEHIMEQLTYDPNLRLWRAHATLALRDMKITHRNCDLIDWNTVNELI